MVSLDRLDRFVILDATAEKRLHRSELLRSNVYGGGLRRHNTLGIGGRGRAG